MKKIMLVVMLIVVSVYVTAGNIIIEEDSMEIGTVNAQNHVFPTENAYLSYGLVGYWSGDNNALDYSGKGNDGTLNGGITYTDGKFGKAFNFDGVNDYINVSNPANFRSNILTVSFWIYPIGDGSDYYNNVFVQSGSNYKNSITWQQQGGQYIRWWNTTTNSNAYWVYKNVWTHIVILCNSSSHGKIYINGVDVTIGSEICLSWASSSGNFYIGGNPSNNDYYFNGSIDDLRIWNRSLSQAEIRRLYDEYWIPGDTTETRNYYTTGSVSASTFVDLTPAWGKTPAEALNELLRVESETDVSGNALINHNSLPEFTKVKILKGANAVNCTEVCDNVDIGEGESEYMCYEECDTEYIYEDGRNIGATVTMLVEAIKALNEMNVGFNNQREELANQIIALKIELCKHNNNYNWC